MYRCESMYCYTPTTHPSTTWWECVHVSLCSRRRTVTHWSPAVRQEKEPEWSAVLLCASKMQRHSEFRISWLILLLYCSTRPLSAGQDQVPEPRSRGSAACAEDPAHQPGPGSWSGGRHHHQNWGRYPTVHRQKKTTFMWVWVFF